MRKFTVFLNEYIPNPNDDFGGREVMVQHEVYAADVVPANPGSNYNAIKFVGEKGEAVALFNQWLRVLSEEE